MLSAVVGVGSGVVARRRPTLPHLEVQYHGRRGVSRPSSGWDRVYQPCDDHRATRPDPRNGNGCVGGESEARLGAACGAVLVGRRGVLV